MLGTMQSFGFFCYSVVRGNSSGFWGFGRVRNVCGGVGNIGVGGSQNVSVFI